jgi:hypothetical protein
MILATIRLLESTNALEEQLIDHMKRTKNMFKLIAIITLLGKHIIIKILISVLKEYSL